MTLDAAAKYTMTVADYSGVRAGALVHADFAETVNRAGHATPTVDAPAGSWVVSYWADKSAATTGFALPGSVTGRQALCSTGTGHVCSSLADSDGAVPTGQYGGLVATADTASGDGDDLVDRPAHHRAEPGSDGVVHLHLRQRGLRLRRHRLERPRRLRGLLRLGLRRRRHRDRRDRRATTS